MSNSRKQINVLIYVTVCLYTGAGTEKKNKAKQDEARQDEDDFAFKKS